MTFATRLAVDLPSALRALGYEPGRADGQILGAVYEAAAAVESAATPRWVGRRLAVGRAGGRPGAAGYPGLLTGADASARLSGCDACFLLAVTLGGGVDALLRAAMADDVARGVLADTCASVLTEQYAAAAVGELARQFSGRPLFFTPRLSPGCGDYPLAAQKPLLAALDAQRIIGLAAGPAGTLHPRKSVTAVLGAAAHPAGGKVTGCAVCQLRGRCAYEKGGRPCGENQAVR